VKTILNLATIGVVGLSLVALYLYFRPPTGDEEPITDEALRHFKYQQSKRGDEI